MSTPTSTPRAKVALPLISQRGVLPLVRAAIATLGLVITAVAVWALAGATVSNEPPLWMAWRVAWNSDVMATLAIGLMALTWVVVGASRRRAISPPTSWRNCVAFGPFDEVVARRCLAATVSRRSAIDAASPPMEPGLAFRAVPSLAGWLTAGICLVVLAIAALIVLAVSGHFPVDGFSVVPTAVAAVMFVIAAAWGAHLLVRNQLRASPLGVSLQALLARRGPHTAVIASVGEVALGLSTAAVISVFAHTGGSPAPSIPEVVAVAILARLVTMTPAPALALGWADAVLIIGLIAIDTPVAVAIAATVAWRATQFAAIAGGWLTATKVTKPTDTAADEVITPTHSRLGEVFHRASFALLALLPGGGSRWIRRRVFDAMFGMADDPWSYAQMPYEQRRQARLLATMPADARVILEIGCAAGHNLVALAIQYPKSTVIGVDISARAVALARNRVHPYSNVIVAVSDFRDVDTVLGEYAGYVDVLILSEVLYYVGVASQLTPALRPVGGLLRPGACVVLVHGTSHAERLHPAACRALGAFAASATLVNDPDRPFTITTARVR